MGEPSGMSGGLLTKSEYGLATIALLRGRVLLGFPDDLAPFCSVVRTPAGQIGEVFGWLGRQDPACIALQGGVEMLHARERIALVYVLTEPSVGGGQITLWPAVKINYVAESELLVVEAPMRAPGLAGYFTVRVLAEITADATAASSEWKPAVPN